MKLAHIVNPVAVSPTSDLFVAQPVTFESMRIARDFADDELDVHLLCAHYPEDDPMAPNDFLWTEHLTRSVLDVGSFQHSRKLPLLKDILDRMYAAAGDADYLIYTNVDIALQPHFYRTVREVIRSGRDAFVINRRTISSQFARTEQLPLMYAALGAAHPGYDCFVFARHLYPHFFLADVCIGANRIGKVFLLNLLCTAERFHEFADLHMTFHIGDDRVWRAEEFSDYDKHNDHQLEEVWARFESQGLIPNHTLASLCMPRARQKQSASYLTIGRNVLARIRRTLCRTLKCQVEPARGASGEPV